MRQPKFEASKDHSPTSGSFLLVALLIFVTSAQQAWSQYPAPGNIELFAGGSNGDGGPATQAVADVRGMIGPRSTLDSALYLADGKGNRIRKVDLTTDTISTIAGTGVGGMAGDGGPALSAQLWNPLDIAFDAQGNMYVSEMTAHRVRRIDTAGTITTVAGNGVAGYSGDGGPAVQANISTPYGIAVSATGNLYIADFDNYRVRMVDTKGIIHTVAGTGISGYTGDGGPASEAQLGTPSDVLLDSYGNLYIVDYIDSVVRRVDPQGIITTVVGIGFRGFAGDGGPATQAMMNLPFRAVFDPRGNLLIADMGNNRVRRVDALTQVITTIAGTGVKGSSGDGGPGTLANLYSPSSVAVDFSGNVYIGGSVSTSAAWSYDNRVRILNIDGIINTAVGLSNNGDGGPALDGIIDPYGLSTGGTLIPADLYIADTRNNQVRKISSRTEVISTVAGSGTPGYSGDGGPAINASLNAPADVTVDTTGIVWIADNFNHRVRRVDTRGYISTFAGNGRNGYAGDGGDALSASLNYPHGVAVDGAGNLFIADSSNYRIRKVTPQRIITTVAGNGTWGSTGDGGLATQAQLAYPTDIAIGSDGSLYIPENGTHKIRKVNPSGIISTIAGTGLAGFGGDGGPATAATLNGPTQIALDAQGNLFIADAGNRRTRRVDAVSGIITTVAGTGTEGNEGDGGPATKANLYPVSGVALDTQSGYLYISQEDSARLRVVSLLAAASTPTATGTPMPTGTPSRTTAPILTATSTPTKTSTKPPTLTATLARTATPSPTPTPLGISGQILYYSNAMPVAGAAVQLISLPSGGSGGAVSTDATGRFAMQAAGGASWQIQPEMLGSVGSAVSSLDAVYVLQSAVGLRNLDGQQQLACDVNGDGAVSSLDASFILQYSVGLIQRFPVADPTNPKMCGSDWAFIPVPAAVPYQTIILPQSSSSGCQPGAIAYQPLTGQAASQNFLALVYGDCTGNWQPSLLAPAAAFGSSSDSTTQIRVGRYHHRGRTGRVPLYVDAPKGFHAVNVQIRYDAARMDAVGARLLGRNNQALIAANTRIPGVVSVAIASAQTLQSGPLLMLDFAARDPRHHPAVRLEHVTVNE